MDKIQIKASKTYLVALKSNFVSLSRIISWDNAVCILESMINYVADALAMFGDVESYLLELIVWWMTSLQISSIVFPISVYINYGFETTNLSLLLFLFEVLEWFFFVMSFTVEFWKVGVESSGSSSPKLLFSLIYCFCFISRQSQIIFRITSVVITEKYICVMGLRLRAPICLFLQISNDGFICLRWELKWSQRVLTYPFLAKYPAITL